jgi:hypothetical protein
MLARDGGYFNQSVMILSAGKSTNNLLFSLLAPVIMRSQVAELNRSSDLTVSSRRVPAGNFYTRQHITSAIKLQQYQLLTAPPTVVLPRLS